uniref:Uncharacterized protein n=1 Tax=Anguilla anguilla TaxID=7936 RepID=A0A0E9WCC9_ANGAN
MFDFLSPIFKKKQKDPAGNTTTPVRRT